MFERHRSPHSAHELGLNLIVSPCREAEPIHVLLAVHRFYPDHFYGTEAYTRAIARQLMAAGHRATVLTTREAGEAPQSNAVEEYFVDGIRVFRIDRNCFPEECARDSYEPRSLVPIYQFLLRKIAPDILHICHLSNLGTPLLDVAKGLGVPIFATLTDFFNLCLTGSLETTDGRLCPGPSESRSNCLRCGIAIRAAERPSVWWRALAGRYVREAAATAATRLLPVLPPPLSTDVRAVIERPAVLFRAMRHYRAAVAPTRILARTFLQNGCEAPIEIHHFGLDIDRSGKPIRTGGALRIGFIGQFVYQKGLHLLLQALLPLPPADYELTIWGTEGDSARYYADLKGVAALIPATFRGTFQEPDAASILAELDVLVMPSTWHENSPLTMLKGLATHTPVIVSDVEGMTEFVIDGVNGLVFPRGNVAKLSDILRRLIADRALLLDLTANTHYRRTERDMALDLLDVYRQYGVETTQPPGTSRPSIGQF